MRQIAILCSAALSVTLAFAQPGDEQRALLSRYCFTCHNEKLKTGGLGLDKLDIQAVDSNVET